MNELVSPLATLLSTMLNSKNLTKNNIGFLAGLTVSAGLIVYGILNIFMPAILAVLFIFVATGVFGYRTLTKNEEKPVTERIAGPQSRPFSN